MEQYDIFSIQFTETLTDVTIHYENTPIQIYWKFYH